MAKVIDSDVVIRAYFNKHKEKTQIEYAKLKQIRYEAEPHVGAYIDVTYTSLRRLQLAHRGIVQMDKAQITIVDDSLRTIEQSERSIVAKIEQYL